MYISVSGLIAHVSLNIVHSVAYPYFPVRSLVIVWTCLVHTHTYYSSSQLLYQLRCSIVVCLKVEVNSAESASNLRHRVK